MTDRPPECQQGMQQQMGRVKQFMRVTIGPHAPQATTQKPKPASLGGGRGQVTAPSHREERRRAIRQEGQAFFEPAPRISDCTT